MAKPSDVLANSSIYILEGSFDFAKKLPSQILLVVLHDHHNVHCCCLAIKWLFLNQEISYLYDLGQIIFCRIDNGIIVTNVDWLLHNFRSIIQLHDSSSGSLDIQSLYSQASQTVKISTKYINHFLSLS